MKFNVVVLIMAFFQVVGRLVRLLLVGQTSH